ncbi:hypothetical protein CEXT_528321 [Caerostris extrusa]|uniref:Uncharacterized protein n=1 Tax=Caerostris extrusa TaxID=172846 RepID=A0AAV4T2V2_CAEEX|nr:hypothetical protein CEXT_528321 [Caerostris extrusa]
MIALNWMLLVLEENSDSDENDTLLDMAIVEGNSFDIQNTNVELSTAAIDEIIMNIAKQDLQPKKRTLHSSKLDHYQNLTASQSETPPKRQSPDNGSKQVGDTSETEDNIQLNRIYNRRIGLCILQAGTLPKQFVTMAQGDTSRRRQSPAKQDLQSKKLDFASFKLEQWFKLDIQVLRAFLERTNYFIRSKIIDDPNNVIYFLHFYTNP